MNFDQIVAFAILFGMMALFVWDKIRYDLTALLGLVAAIALGIVPANKAFSGFSDPVVVIVGSALVISAGVSKSGVIGRMVRRVEPKLGSQSLLVLFLSSAVAILSSFVKNIGALAIFMPVALQLARRRSISPSTLLMPMAFASLIGGLVTLVGTSPNVLVSRVRQEILGEPYKMFDFAPVGIGILIAGLAFIAVGWRLLPTNRKGQTGAADAFKVEAYQMEATLPAGSPFVDKTVANLEALSEGDVAVVAIIREQGKRRYAPAGHWWLFADDILVLQGDAHALNALTKEAGLIVGAEAQSPAPNVASKDAQVVEAVVMADSPLVGQTTRHLRLRDRYGINLIAVGRPGSPTQSRLGGTRFQVGDVLILQGPDTLLDILRELDCLPLVDRGARFGETRKDYLPLGLLAAAILLIATGIGPIDVTFFGAAVLLVATRVLSLKEAYEALDAPILILLACLIPISDAISTTGGANLIAGGLASVSHGLPPSVVVAILMVAAMAITPFLNNAATVLMVAPIAGGVAQRLGVNPDPFLMAVAIGAACDFLTPIGHQCNTLVMGPGGYRFGDYWKLGLPLSFIVLVTGTFLITLFWRF